MKHLRLFENFLNESSDFDPTKFKGFDDLAIKVKALMSQFGYRWYNEEDLDKAGGRINLAKMMTDSRGEVKTSENGFVYYLPIDHKTMSAVKKLNLENDMNIPIIHSDGNVMGFNVGVGDSTYQYLSPESLVKLAKLGISAPQTTKGRSPSNFQKRDGYWGKPMAVDISGDNNLGKDYINVDDAKAFIEDLTKFAEELPKMEWDPSKLSQGEIIAAIKGLRHI